MYTSFQRNRFTLLFDTKEVEKQYKEVIYKETWRFSQITWGIIIVLGVLFGLLDKMAFGEGAAQVLPVRILLVVSAIVMLSLSRKPVGKKLLSWNSFIFMHMIGLFSIFLLSMGDTQSFSPYLIGIIMAFAGVFTNTGIGFRYALVALANITTIFVVTVGWYLKVESELFWIYSLFIISSAGIFGFIAYLVERLARDNFIIASQLRESLHKVKTLSGFIPICAKCKKIRDDQGYWSQIEQYICQHSEAEFSHSLCPECSDIYLKEMEPDN